MSADGPCDDHTPDTATLVGSAATISSLPLCSRGDRLRNEMAHPPGAMTVLKLAAPSRAAVVIPLFGKLRRHSANVAALIHQWRITERTPQMRRRGGRRNRFERLMLVRTSSQHWTVGQTAARTYTRTALPKALECLP